MSRIQASHSSPSPSPSPSPSSSSSSPHKPISFTQSKPDEWETEQILINELRRVSRRHGWTYRESTSEEARIRWSRILDEEGWEEEDYVLPFEMLTDSLNKYLSEVNPVMVARKWLNGDIWYDSETPIQLCKTRFVFRVITEWTPDCESQSHYERMTMKEIAYLCGDGYFLSCAVRELD